MHYHIDQHIFKLYSIICIYPCSSCQPISQLLSSYENNSIAKNDADVWWWECLITIDQTS